MLVVGRNSVRHERDAGFVGFPVPRISS